MYGKNHGHPRDGQYQLYAKEMIADGVGALYIAFEQLKKKLEAKATSAKIGKDRYRAILVASV